MYEKISGEKKKVRKEESVRKIGKHLNFFAKFDDIKPAFFFSRMPMILLMYKKNIFKL